MEQTERIFKILDRQLIDVEFKLSIFGPTVRKSNIRRVLESTSYFQNITKSHNGIADKYARRTKPTSSDLSSCKDCRRINGTAVVRYLMPLAEIHRFV